MVVLTSEAEPICNFLQSAISSTTALNSPNTTPSLHEQEQLAFLKMNDYDMERVEAIVRSAITSRGTSIPKKLEEYRKLMDKYVKSDEEYSDFSTLLESLKFNKTRETM